MIITRSLLRYFLFSLTIIPISFLYAERPSLQEEEKAAIISFASKALNFFSQENQLFRLEFFNNSEQADRFRELLTLVTNEQDQDSLMLFEYKFNPAKIADISSRNSTLLYAFTAYKTYSTIIQKFYHTSLDTIISEARKALMAGIRFIASDPEVKITNEILHYAYDYHQAFLPFKDQLLRFKEKLQNLATKLYEADRNIEKEIEARTKDQLNKTDFSATKAPDTTAEAPIETLISDISPTSTSDLISKPQEETIREPNTQSVEQAVEQETLLIAKQVTPPTPSELPLSGNSTSTDNKQQEETVIIIDSVNMSISDHEILPEIPDNQSKIPVDMPLQTTASTDVPQKEVPDATLPQDLPQELPLAVDPAIPTAKDGTSTEAQQEVPLKE